MKTLIIVLFFLIYSNAEFIRDNSSNLIIDTSRSLIWKNNFTNSTTSWETLLNPIALTNSKCANMTYANYSDWRLANINELKTIIDYNKTDPAINSIFINIPASNNANLNFLSSTTAVPSSSVWYVNFWSGEILSFEKDGSNTNENMYYFCVRNR